ncbi:MAG TPA: IclR family transcriptional regulator [Ktedonosporobacter sp.]|nr:IclR family transcriptional regulator [Ktedonosporobacter sp.]
MEENISGGMLAKGLTLLVTLGQYPDGIGLSDLARQVGMPVSTAHRLLATLSAFGFVHFDADYRRYSLGLRLFELSHQVSLVRGLSEVAVPVMQRLVQITGETSLISVLDGDEMVYVERIDSPHPIQVRGSMGRRDPVYCTAMGKSLLAFRPDEEREAIVQRLKMKRLTPHTITDRNELRRELDRTRERGYSLADEEHEAGIRTVAVPVLDSRGRAIAALCVTAPAFRATLEQLIQNVPVLQEAAREISVQLPRGGASAAGLR